MLILIYTLLTKQEDKKMNNEIISVEIFGKKRERTYLHGSEEALKSFKKWLNGHEAYFSKDNNVLIMKNVFHDCMLEASLRGLRPSRMSSF